MVVIKISRGSSGGVELHAGSGPLQPGRVSLEPASTTKTSTSGVIIHLYSGKDCKTWTAEDWNGYEILNVDIALGTQFDMHAVGTWGYLCHLARNGHVVAVVGGPPCRSVSRLRHREPGPRPLRGRDERRFGLEGSCRPWSRTWPMGTWRWS